MRAYLRPDINAEEKLSVVGPLSAHEAPRDPLYLQDGR